MSDPAQFDPAQPDPAQPDPGDLLELACRLAVNAGDQIQDMRAAVMSGTPEAETKSSSVDLVTAADRAAEATIVAGLAKERPHDGVLGEEGASRVGTTGTRWIIDPIDGTTNYVYGIASYSVSIAVEHEGTLLAGAVYDPAGEVLFAAARGRGATRNGHPITAGSRAELATALVATGFGFVADRRRGQAEVLLALLPQIRDIRRFGSAALDLCSVACGQVDAYYEKGLNYWDYAAGRVVAEEAGVVVGNLRGGPPDPGFVVAAGPLLFETLADALRVQGADDKP